MRCVEPIEDRLARRCRVTASGCWEWTGTVQKNGYGKTSWGSRAGGSERANVYTHRIAYQLWVGPVPKGKELDHLCRNRLCFNPAHLEPVTRAENTRRGKGPAMLGAFNGTKTHCARGHAYDAENTYQRPGGGRACRKCARLYKGRPVDEATRDALAEAVQSDVEMATMDASAVAFG